jgi:hypothetical protein
MAVLLHAEARHLWRWEVDQVKANQNFDNPSLETAMGFLFSREVNYENDNNRAEARLIVAA